MIVICRIAILIDLINRRARQDRREQDCRLRKSNILGGDYPRPEKLPDRWHSYRDKTTEFLGALGVLGGEKR
jgi:hypothetical protein